MDGLDSLCSADLQKTDINVYVLKYEENQVYH